MTLGANIDGQGIMAFVELQADAKDHGLGNANEGEEVAALEVERVEALDEVGVALVLTQIMWSLNDRDSLQGVSWPFVCKLVHVFWGLQCGEVIIMTKLYDVHSSIRQCGKVKQ